MKKVLGRLLTFTTVILMIALTAGISVYSHYCTCTSNQKLSVLVYQGCSDNHCSDSETHKADVSCCATTENPDHGYDAICYAHDCCITEEKVVQITSEYQPSTIRLLPLPLHLPSNQTFILAFNPDFQPKEPFGIDQAHSPPHQSSRHLLIFLHQLRIPEPVC